MACGSVAVSKASISPMFFDASTLQSIVAKLLGVDGSIVRYYKSSWSEFQTAECNISGLMYTVSQDLYPSGEIKTELTVYGSVDQSKAQAEIDRLQPMLDRQLTVAQQTTVLKRLAQLGKLSNVKQKDNGVTARLEITI